MQICKEICGSCLLHPTKLHENERRKVYSRNGVANEITGDFNQWDISAALQNFPDVGEVDVSATRGGLSIDRILCNDNRSVEESGTWAPLEMEGFDSKQSDHRITFCTVELRRVESFKWKTYTYRHFSKESEDLFKSWIVMHNWKEVFEANDSNSKTDTYQRTF